MKINKRKFTILIISLLIALGIVGVQYKYFSEMSKKEPYVNVYIADGNLKRGDRVEFKVKSITQSSYIGNMIKEGEEIGGFIGNDLKSGSYIFKEMLYNTKPPVIKEGYRRVTISTGLTSSIAGGIREGDYVDVCYVEGGGEGGQVILKKVQIYSIYDSKGKTSIENKYSYVEGVPDAVTLIVTPEQGVMLKQCEAKGVLSLMGY